MDTTQSLISIIQLKKNELLYLESLTNNNNTSLPKMNGGEQNRSMNNMNNNMNTMNNNMNTTYSIPNTNYNNYSNNSFLTPSQNYNSLNSLKMSSPSSKSSIDVIPYDKIKLLISSIFINENIDYTNIESDNKNNKEILNTLKNEINIQYNENGRLGKQVNELIKERNEALALSELFSKQISEQKEDTKKYISVYKKNKHHYINTIQNLQNEIKTAQEQIEVLNDKNAQLKQDFESYKYENDKTKHILTKQIEGETVNIKQLRHELLISQKLNHHLEEENVSLKNKLSQSETIWKSHLSEVEAIRIEKSKIDARLQKVEIEKEEMRKTMRVNNELTTIASNIQKISATPLKFKLLGSPLILGGELSIKPSEVSNIIKSPTDSTLETNPFTSKSTFLTPAPVNVNMSVANDKSNKYEEKSGNTKVFSSNKPSTEFSIGIKPVESNLFQSYVPQRISTTIAEKNNLTSPLSRKQRKSLQDAEKVAKSISFLTPTGKSSPKLSKSELKKFDDSNSAFHANSNDSSSDDNATFFYNKKSEEYNDYEEEQVIYSPPTLYGKTKSSKPSIKSVDGLSKSRFLKDDALDEIFGDSKKSDSNFNKKKLSNSNTGLSKWPIISDEDD